MTSIAIDRLDGLSSATAIKGPVRVATTTNITLSGTQTIDGVAVVADDRVLVKDQTTGSENGIYVAATGAWRRAKDFSRNNDVRKGTRILVTDGTVGAGREYYVSTANPITIGTTSITLTETDASAAGQGAVLNSDTSTADMDFVVDEDDMASDSDTKIPTQQSVKAYVDDRTPASHVATRTALKALATALVTNAYLTEEGREGQFIWRSGDYSTQVTADPQEGIYIKADAIASTSGAWVRVHDGYMDIRYFGALQSATDNSTAIQAAIDCRFGPVRIPGGYFRYATALEISDGCHIVGASPLGTPGVGYVNFPMQSILVYTGSAAGFITADDTTFINQGSLANFSVYAASATWIFDFEGLLGFNINDINAKNTNTAGGVLRGRAVSGDPTWINRLQHCTFTAELTGTQYCVDIDWTDSVISGCEIGGGLGTRWENSSGSNLRISNTQFENATSAGAGFTLVKNGAGNCAVLFSSCVFDNNIVGMIVDASSSPSGSLLCLSMSSCSFRAKSGTGTDDIVFVDGPSALSGPMISACAFTNSAITTPIDYNKSKWTIEGLLDNVYASGWSPVLDFTPALQFGGSGTGITYSVQNGHYTKQGKKVTFDLQLSLSSKGAQTGNNTIIGMPASAANVTGVQVGNSASFTGLTGGLYAYISGSAIVIAQGGSAGLSTLADTAFTNSTVIRVSGTYFTS